MKTAAPVPVTKQEEFSSSDLEEILEGLSQAQKTISPKYFYDQTGSKLFDQICMLPEYYLTRTEMQIMRNSVDEIAQLIGPQASLIEFGSGSSMKTRLLLSHLNDLAAYVPVDISHDHLVQAANKLSQDFPHIEVLPVVADFTQPFQLPSPRIMPRRNLVYFPGSTIGNFSPDAAQALLGVMRQEAGADGALLIGVDLKKDPAIIEEAYNDSAGITARFNLNVLKRINREFSANFDLRKFEHRAVYDEKFGRIEMQLHSLCAHEFTVGGQVFRLAEGEFIVTEHSHKYALDEFLVMAGKAGFDLTRVWTDPDQMFSVHFYQCNPLSEPAGGSNS